MRGKRLEGLEGQRFGRLLVLGMIQSGLRQIRDAQGREAIRRSGANPVASAA